MGKRFISSDKPKMSKSYAIMGDYRYMPYTTGKGEEDCGSKGKINQGRVTLPCRKDETSNLTGTITPVILRHDNIWGKLIMSSRKKKSIWKESEGK